MVDIGRGSFRATYGRQMNIITVISRKKSICKCKAIPYLV